MSTTPEQDPPSGISERQVAVHSPLELAALLKKVHLASSGGEAKARIRSGEVRVNGMEVRTPSTRVAPGDRVTVAGETFRLVQS